eukprot:4622136-Amphidinium_carterae.2
MDFAMRVPAAELQAALEALHFDDVGDSTCPHVQTQAKPKATVIAHVQPSIARCPSPLAVPALAGGGIKTPRGP